MAPLLMRPAVCWRTMGPRPGTRRLGHERDTEAAMAGGPGVGRRGPGGGLDEGAVPPLLAAPDCESLLAAAMAAVDLAPGTRVEVAALYRLDDDGLIRLAAAIGAPDELVERYRVVSAAADLPFAQVIRDHEPVYGPPREPPAEPREPAARDEEAAGAADGTPPAEYAVLPLLVGSRCVGSLALTLPGGVPLDAARHRAFLTVAALCAHRFDELLALTPRDRAPGGGSRARDPHPPQARDRATMLEMAMANAGIGSFDWDFASGRLIWDERLCRLFGIAPEEFDGRIETFHEAVLPEDRPRVEAAVRESLVTGRYQVRYRVVRRDDKAIRWIDAESRVLYDTVGKPRGMIGVAQDSTEAQNREDERQARKDFVLNITRAFTAASSIDDVVATVADTVLPALGGQRMAIYLKEDGGRMRLIGSHGYDAAHQERLRNLADIGIESPFLAGVRDGEPMFIESREEFFARIRDERLAPMPGLHAWAILPLATADGLVGACLIIYDHPRAFSFDDQLVVAGVAGILAQSLARARLFDERRAHLTELQRMMLPGRLPSPPGLDVLVRYRPGSDRLDVGGDWYDALPMPDDRITVVIGDVQGHNVRAAAVMGQLRIAMRAHAAEGHQLSALMARGNRALCDMDTDLFATCCVVDIDPADGRLRIVRAGHPHPLLIAPDGGAALLESPGGIPLGCFDDADYPVTEAVLPEGATLLLYTDGLVERPGGDYDDGVAELSARLADAAAAAGPVGRSGLMDLERLADRVVTPAVSAPNDDDVAVLLVHRRPRTAPAD
ncbi:SpoIIE family protein phosphatase [Streptomyces sp. XD-27]|uniref:SpoIIE family protein phosphatase n=1 Tax=Streptomyces sp. XD-27 TaxID=3062779 RepID=UPI0026F47A54|nr:SpoIIE family protein phosphatase [Streptomyces sp. XD-27]WKX73939.1 SpoIIE family protein phosphatase [Streptomyces sp. XD-27]